MRPSFTPTARSGPRLSVNELETVRAFTGPSKLTLEQEAFVRGIVRDLGVAGEDRSGAAYGVDTVAALNTQARKLALVVPVGRVYNEALVVMRRRAPGVIVERVNGGYRIRNEALVAPARELHAFVRSPEFYRSGEWMTINIAERRGVKVVTYVLPPAAGL
jgi:hypothetical protein